VQTLNNFIQIKAKALGHQKKPVNQVISSGAPWQCHKFLSWFKVDGRIIANLIRLLFWRGCGLLDDQHIFLGVLGRNWYLTTTPLNYGDICLKLICKSGIPTQHIAQQQANLCSTVCTSYNPRLLE